MSRLTPGSETIVTIEDVASDGRGVARAAGQVIFVPWTVDGERVRVRVVRAKRHYAEAELVEILDPSPFRVPAPCLYFSRCGGCAYQHIRYDHQLDLKRKQIADAMRRIAGLPQPPVDPVIPSPVPYEYRDRMTVHRAPSGAALGFFATDNRTIVDIERCWLALPALNRRLQALRATDRATGPLEITLHAEPGAVIQKPAGGAVLDVPPDAFFQVNPLALPALLDTVSGLVGPATRARLIDAYCGVGLFTFLLAARFESIIGLEANPEAVEWARTNAARLDLAHCTFMAGLVERRLPSVLSFSGDAATLLLLDPPRTGCHPDVVRAVSARGPAEVIYVSCSPATLARDLKGLKSAYRVDRLIPIDMFPQTIHCEGVAHLYKTTDEHR